MRQYKTDRKYVMSLEHIRNTFLLAIKKEYPKHGGICSFKVDNMCVNISSLNGNINNILNIFNQYYLELLNTIKNRKKVKIDYSVFNFMYSTFTYNGFSVTLFIDGIQIRIETIS